MSNNQPEQPLPATFPTASQGREQLIVEQDALGINANGAIPLEEFPQNFIGNNGTNRFGAVRDRLFHVMLVKMALSYNRNCSVLFRRLLEFVLLLVVSCIFIYSFSYKFETI